MTTRMTTRITTAITITTTTPATKSLLYHKGQGRQPRQRRLRHVRSNTLSFSMMMMRTNLLVVVVGLCLLLLLVSNDNSAAVVRAKEIEATHEWTLLGENDTVAAGMHVRMDLTTGEKWVKLMDENDEKDEPINDSPPTGSEMVISQVVDANGKVTTAAGSSSSSSSSSNSKYGYEMMHRALSKLPPEEQERMGGIPKLPPTTSTTSTGSKITPEQRLAFEKQLQDIWERRQAELRAFQEDHLADLPKLLKNRIAKIQDYLQDPITHLKALELLETNDDEENDDDNDKDDDSVIAGDILSVLKDLEYQLTDLDMTRDFYTLGGWPLLTSLLADAVHEIGNNSTQQQQQLTDEDWHKVNLLQAHAAWTIGTAVKNTAEFNPYGTVEVEVLHNNNGHGAAGAVAEGSTKTNKLSTVKTTPLDLVLAQFVASSNAILDSSTSPKDDYYDGVMMKVHKTLYALGSLLCGNRHAQTHFCADQGPALLGNLLVQLADQAEANNSNPPSLPSRDVLKVAQRLLSLAHDIVMDVTLHASTSDQVDTAIRNAFSTPQWCTTLVRFTQIPSLLEVTLLTIQQLAPYCGSSWDVLQLQAALLQPPTEVHQAWLPEDLDHDIRKERMELLESTVQTIQKAGQS